MVKRPWILTGEVKAIDSEKQTLLVRIDSREMEIPITPNIPEWLCFEPLGYDHLTDDELLDNLINLLERWTNETVL